LRAPHRAARVELHTRAWLYDWILDGLIEELIVQKPPVITGKASMLEACPMCLGEPIRKDRLPSGSHVTTVWGRAPCGVWCCEKCLDVCVREDTQIFTLADVLNGKLEDGVCVIRCRAADAPRDAVNTDDWKPCDFEASITDFFFTSHAGAKMTVWDPRRQELDGRSGSGATDHVTEVLEAARRRASAARVR
jgi:hypothetical protein